MADETNEQQGDVRRATPPPDAMAFCDTIQRLGRALADGLRPLMDAFMESVGVLGDEFRRRYDVVGAPYGLGDEAMWRWWHDLAEAQRRQQTDLDQRLRVWAVTDFARQLHDPDLPRLSAPQALPLAEFVSLEMREALKVALVVSEKGDADGRS